MVFVKDTEWGEDSEHVDEILRDLFPDYKYKGIFIDVGANHPIWLNNSYHFEKAGWTTICIEANPNLIDNLKKHRKDVLHYAILDENKIGVLKIYNSKCPEKTAAQNMAGYTSIKEYYNFEKFNSKVKVVCKTLNWVLKNKYPKIQNIDIISIDVEGAEQEVLNGLDILKYSPKVFCIETTNGAEFLSYLKQFGYIEYTPRIPLVYNTIYILRDYFKEGIIVQ